eukprot:TRINITY_DN32206_c0_g1_i1.p1 TRINITY_DN32206_c0_g1~~TRINITY_DN32206_c0_g1_i1.p1  ORF type:complete len:304 (+),score=30.75 TRINITY_DN32206_c0_g1_i1:97-1008(+)
MCFTEELSWTTLAVGTTLNLIVAGVLYRWVHEWRVGCILVAAWQFGLLMQLPEAMVWRTNGNGDWEKTAFALNVLQPHAWVATGCGILYYTHDADSSCGLGPLVMERLSGCPTLCRVLGVLRWLIPVSVLIAYTAAVGEAIPRCEFRMTGCDELTLSWWADCLSGPPLFLYFAASITASTMMPPGWAAVILTVWVATLIVSAELYECGSGSMWCWMISWANAVTLVMAFVFQRLGYPRRPPTQDVVTACGDVEATESVEPRGRWLPPPKDEGLSSMASPKAPSSPVAHPCEAEKAYATPSPAS